MKKGIFFIFNLVITILITRIMNITILKNEEAVNKTNILIQSQDVTIQPSYKPVVGDY